MTHRDFVRPSAQYPGELVPCSGDYQRWDVAQSVVVNGDAGGSWSPSAPIIIGGAGLSVAAGSSMTGGLTTATGGRIVIGVGDRPTFASTQTDTLVVPALAMQVPGNQMATVDLVPDDDYNVVLTPYVGLQSSNATSAVLEIPGRFLHIGAALKTFKLRLRVVTKPTSLPSPVPYFYPIAWNAGGSLGQGLTPPPGAAFNQWQATHLYAQNAYVAPTTVNVNGFYFKATTGGTSAGSEPAWPTTVGNTVGDGGVTWTCIGHSGQIVAHDAPTYYNNGLVWTVQYDWDGTANNGVDTTTYRYGIVIVGVADASTTDPTQNLVMHSLEIDLSNISDLRFE